MKLKKIPQNPTSELYFHPPYLAKIIEYNTNDIKIPHRVNRDNPSNLPQEMPATKEGELLGLRYISKEDDKRDITLAILCGPNPQDFYSNLRQQVNSSIASKPEILIIPRDSLEKVLAMREKTFLSYTR